MGPGLTFGQCVRVRPTLRPTPYVGLEGCVTRIRRSADRQDYVYTLDFPSFGSEEWASFPMLAADVEFFEWELEAIGTILEAYNPFGENPLRLDSYGRRLGLRSQELNHKE